MTPALLLAVMHGCTLHIRHHQDHKPSHLVPDYKQLTRYQTTINPLGTSPHPLHLLASHSNTFNPCLIFFVFLGLLYHMGFSLQKENTRVSLAISKPFRHPCISTFFSSQHVKDTRGIMKPRLGTVVLGQLCSPSDSFARKTHVLFTHHPHVLGLCRTRRVY